MRSFTCLAPPSSRGDVIRALQPPGRRAPLLQLLQEEAAARARAGGERAPPRPPAPPGTAPRSTLHCPPPPQHPALRSTRYPASPRSALQRLAPAACCTALQPRASTHLCAPITPPPSTLPAALGTPPPPPAPSPQHPPAPRCAAGTAAGLGMACGGTAAGAILRGRCRRGCSTLAAGCAPARVTDPPPRPPVTANSGVHVPHVCCGHLLGVPALGVTGAGLAEPLAARLALGDACPSRIKIRLNRPCTGGKRRRTAAPMPAGARHRAGLRPPPRPSPRSPRHGLSSASQMASATDSRYGQKESSDQNFDYMFKILIIGNSSVGKTSFLFRYADDSFTPAFVSTVGIDFKVKTIYRNDKRIKLQIWDTAGQERYRTITTAYYRGAMGFILMYDITNEESFNAVQDWSTQIKTYSWDNAQVLLVGNKCDMEDERVVSSEKGRQLAEHLGFEFFEASAKDNINVKQTFERLVDIICEKMSESLDTADPAVTGAKQGPQLTDQQAPPHQDCAC
ncbi:hypothetical protein QYF61_025089 [Mycteria americana]|uniref:small monomeric GTPase n=6 Tax=Neoaves TaxID=3078114 RepID=A0AAN7ML56_MYCAM|nr:hypothetical protein QYF61_025089 [Mycteria americana]